MFDSASVGDNHRTIAAQISFAASLNQVNKESRLARGWESKSVEDQIGEAEAKKDARRKRKLTPEETEHLQRKEALLLERSRIIREMERAYMRRHLVMLERGLAHIDAQLAKLDGDSAA